MSATNRDKGQPPKYINDFSKALASEVRILLAEVGQLRDERRQLQYEIAELMSVKSKHGAGGEYTPDWAPGPSAPPSAPPLDAPPPPPGQDGPVEPARPAWRTVVKRPERRPRHSTPAPAPVQQPQSPVPRIGFGQGGGVPAWAQWQPNPLLSPGPGSGPAHGRHTPTTSLDMGAGRATPDRSGLFGPPTPPPS
ncbi:hypothetical protein PLICRDRAFT_38784 [Plicaturopsis crispa FD-325 SS-3]|nr:hypothetical protein PLICRDRAFT_38784 [Plicaturopsis crispa FD-325 SS-3]